MTSLENHQSKEFTKLLLLGDSGTGKTGSLASLVRAGYKLRVLDYDNGLDILKQLLQRDAPDKLSSVNFITLRDKRRASAVGPILDGPAQAFVSGLKYLDSWSDGLGKPETWGSETVLAVDSLTMMSDAAYDWADALNPGAKDKRQTYFQAQKAIESVISLLTSESFRCNVIVIAHVKYQERPDGTTKGFPTSVGSALGPVIPAYFNSVALVESILSGKEVKRTIRVVSSPMIDLKNPAPFKFTEPAMGLDNGLADFFKKVRS